MDTQAPTLSAEALSLVLQLAASNNWELTIADVEGAFLQGDSLKREDGDVYVELPPGGIPGLPEGTLLKLLKPVYGLSDAPRAWFTKLKKTMIQLGLQQSLLDPCLYHYWNKGQLEGILAVHVDDLMTTGSKTFEKNVLQQLRETFPFKHWKNGGGEFLGRTILRDSAGGIKDDNLPNQPLKNPRWLARTSPYFNGKCESSFMLHFCLLCLFSGCVVKYVLPKFNMARSPGTGEAPWGTRFRSWQSSFFQVKPAGGSFLGVYTP